MLCTPQIMPVAWELTKIDHMFTSTFLLVFRSSTNSPELSHIFCYTLYKGQSNENRTPATKWQWNLFYSKVIARSVNTLIPLGDETINSSLVEWRRSLMDPQPHPLSHFLVRMKPASTNVFLQVAKNLEVTRGKSGLYEGCWNVSQPNLWSLSHQMGTGVIMQKDDSVRQHSRAFWLYGASQHPQQPKKRTTPLCSSLLASISSAGRTHFTLRSPQEQ